MIAPSRTVLVVEDAGSCATTLEIALGQIPGVGVRIAGSAEEARLVLESHPEICAVITDVHLPEDSGLDLVRWVRQRGTPRLPILVISGDTDPETPGASLKLGADAYFRKPFSPAAVRRKLEDLIDAEPHSPPGR